MLPRSVKTVNIVGLPSLPIVSSVALILGGQTTSGMATHAVAVFSISVKERHDEALFNGRTDDAGDHWLLVK